MQFPLQITVRDMAHSEALGQRIQESVARLEYLDPRITRCRVTVSHVDVPPPQPGQFEVQVDVRVTGPTEGFTMRQQDADVYVALRDAFVAITRQVRESVREARAAGRFPAAETDAGS
jgi:ribosome-associated translation inhibitor RaiA